MSNTTTQQPPRIRSTCDACLEAKVRCSRERPSCRRCSHHGRDCVYSFKRRLGRPRGTTSKSSSSSQSQPQPVNTTHPTSNPSTPDLVASGFPRSMPYGTPTDSSTDAGSLCVDSLLMYDHHMNFAGAPGPHDPLFPLWLSGIDGQDMLDLPHHDSAISESLPDGTALQFPSNLSDVSSSLSPRNLESIPSLVDSNNSSIQDLGSGFPSPVPTNQVSFPRRDFSDMTDCMPPNFVSRGFTSYPQDTGSSRQSPTASYVPSMAPSPSMEPYNSLPPPDEAPLTPRCACYANILQRLAELKDERAGLLASRVDNIMKLEKDVRVQTMAMMKCEMCIQKRPRALLLVGVVLESVIDLLECVPVNAAHGIVDPEVQSLDLRNRSFSSDSTSGRLALVGSPLLQLGDFEISGEEKLDFLRHLVLSRLHQLSNTIRLLHEHMQTCRMPSSNFKAAATIMAELSQRVHTLMNRLEA